MITVNEAQIEYQPDMLLAQALTKAAVDMEAHMLITVDGVFADKNNAGRIVINDGAEICVMPILSGG
jgi:sulfur carrier protein ThiS